MCKINMIQKKGISPLIATVLIVGSVISFTVTVNEHTVDPHELVAVIVTVVTPILNDSPDPVPTPLPVVAPLNV